MRLSQLFVRTQREVPAETDVISYQLLHRAGYIRQLAAGIFDHLPLGFKVMSKIEQIIREEMDAVGFQELRLPVVHPAELWQRSGRWDKIGDELLRIKDRSERDYCLAMTHEEVMTHLVAQMVNSYKQLPVLLYQFQTKFRDEPRPRAGLIRTREFAMKDAYSFHENEDAFKVLYWQVYDAYLRIFERCGLDVMTVESDTGIMGGSQAHEFMYLTDIGEDTLVICDNCDYKANRQVAVSKREIYQEGKLELKEVETPNATTIEALAEYLDIPTSKTAKAIFLEGEIKGKTQLIFAVVRGDMELSETKLAIHAGASNLRPALLESIHAVGAEAGYGSPIGIKCENVHVIVDDAVTQSSNLVAGANKEGYHLLNTNYGRDYSADKVADIATAQGGDNCINCGSSLVEKRGVEVGNIFNLGTHFSETLKGFVLNQDGKKIPMHMGSYGIGVGRLMAVLAEASHDEFGIKWHKNVAPYQVVIILLRDKNSDELTEVAEQLYKDLSSSGVEVLFDDRDDNPGVKFKDADLLGIPLQITVGKRSLEKDIVEVKDRMTGKKQEVGLPAIPRSCRTVGNKSLRGEKT